MTIRRITHHHRHATACLFIALISILILNACAKHNETGSLSDSAGQIDEAEWAKIKNTVRERFPEVAQISTAQLDQWLKQPPGQRPVLLDARSRAEYDVSHLPEARCAADETQALKGLKDVSKDQQIVAYCSVGWRSAALAQKLQARGYTNVSNLEGSIFQWANEGRPVYHGNQQASKVHPFDAKWGRLLKEELRAPLSRP